MTYKRNAAIGCASINGKARILKDWSAIASPYLREDLNSGVLEYRNPVGDNWRLGATLHGPQWYK